LVTETPGVPGVFAGWAALGTLVVVATVLQVLSAFPLQASVTKWKLGHELRTAPAALPQRADGVTVPTLRPACATCWQQGWRSAAGANPQSDWRAMRRTVPLHWGRSWKRPSIGVPSLASRATARTQRTKAALFLLPLEPSNAAQGQASAIAARTPRMSAASCAAEVPWPHRFAARTATGATASTKASAGRKDERAVFMTGSRRPFFAKGSMAKDEAIGGRWQTIGR